MVKVSLIIITLISCLYAANSTITTKYRTDLDIVTGKSVTQEYVSTFEIMAGRFVHTVPGVTTSVYVATDVVETVDIGPTSLLTVPCRSEAGNSYLYIFDFQNSRIYTIFSDGTRFVQFDIDVVTQ